MICYTAILRAISAVPPTASNPVPRRIAKFIAASPPAPVFGKPGFVVLPNPEVSVVEPVILLLVVLRLVDAPYVWAPTTPTSDKPSATTSDADASEAIVFFIKFN